MKLRKGILGMCFGLWLGAVSIPLGLFSASHMAALPVAAESVATGALGSPKSWGLVHVLSMDCACSRGVMDYLLERGRSPEVNEEIILLDAGASDLNNLREAGFSASFADSDSFCSKFGSEGVPFFQVINEKEEAAYSGAYYNSLSRAGNGILDLKTLGKLRDGGLVLNRPVFGCPTSDRLKSILDPFNFNKF